MYVGVEGNGQLFLPFLKVEKFTCNYIYRLMLYTTCVDKLKTCTPNHMHAGVATYIHACMNTRGTCIAIAK